MSSNSGPMFGPKGYECVFLTLRIDIPADPLDPESIPLSFDTWTVGPDRATALRTWKRDHRTLAGQLGEVRQVSPAPRVVSDEERERRAVTRTGTLKYS